MLSPALLSILIPVAVGVVALLIGIGITAMIMRQKSALAVGDRITVTGEAGAWRLDSILPRHSVLARPDPLRPHMQRLIAANIDVVVHVVSVKTPPLRPRLIDRSRPTRRT